MKTQLTRQIHNPQNLTPVQYGAKDGWRLLYVSEIRPYDAEFYDCGSWHVSKMRRIRVDKDDENTIRTKQPDPFADGWIRVIDRLATADDLPVWCYVLGKSIRLARVMSEVDATHWRHAKNDIPAPPVVELTQEQKDEAALVEYDKQTWPGCTAGVNRHQRHIWYAALAYERARVKGTQ